VSGKPAPQDEKYSTLIQSYNSFRWTSDTLARGITFFLVQIVTLLGPLYQWHDSFTELFAIFSQGILNPWRNFRKSFSVDQPLFLKIFQQIGERFGADPFKRRHNAIEPYSFVMPYDGDDEDGPFFCDGIDDPFERAQTNGMAILFHSHFITINLTLLILSNQ
jgi:hypothetical protein